MRHRRALRQTTYWKATRVWSACSSARPWERASRASCGATTCPRATHAAASHAWTRTAPATIATSPTGNWGQARNYDLCINSGNLDALGAVSVIKTFVEARQS